MKLAAILFLMIGSLVQIDRSVPVKPTVAPLFMSRDVDAAAAFFVACLNTTSKPVSSESTT